MTSSSPIQTILFGSPGTGKSFRIINEILPNLLKIDEKQNPENVIKTVFHPEYTYGDFMGKLVPITKGKNVQYKFHEGHFLRALAQAYKNILSCYDDPTKNKEYKNWEKQQQIKAIQYKFPQEDHWVKNLSAFQNRVECLYMNLESRSIKIPPNLSIIGTMNTSDNSIYFMDSAFKRRWDWEFVDWEENNDIPDPNYGDGDSEHWGYLTKDEWRELVRGINKFIKSHHQSIRGIEDKQIGFYFIKNYPVTSESIRNKLMFFLWDSVFNRDKKPLLELLEVSANKLVTFGDFTKLHNLFIEKIKIKYNLNILIDEDKYHENNLNNIPF